MVAGVSIQMARCVGFTSLVIFNKVLVNPDKPLTTRPSDPRRRWFRCSAKWDRNKMENASTTSRRVYVVAVGRVAVVVVVVVVVGNVDLVEIVRRGNFVIVDDFDTCGCCCLCRRRDNGAIPP